MSLDPRQKHLLHPELRNMSNTWLKLRSSFPFMYLFPYDSRVAWYGGAVREDGNQGMYMTAAQARDWTKWVNQGDITHGPA